MFPSWVVPAQANGQLALRYRFYITGGQLDAATLGGEIYHSGGLKFANLKNGKSLTVRDFTIDTVNAQLTAYLPALGVRAPILNLDLTKCRSLRGPPYTKVGPVPAALTGIAASVLNDKLGTRPLHWQVSRSVRRTCTRASPSDDDLEVCAPEGRSGNGPEVPILPDRPSWQRGRAAGCARRASRSSARSNEEPREDRLSLVGAAYRW